MVDYPVSDQIDPDEALHLFESCAILIIEDLPVGSEFGIDLAEYRIGEKFKGVKLIPPGVHFVYASAVEKSGRQCAPRSGFFHNFKTKEILVKKWSTLTEDFDDSQKASEEYIERYQKNLRDLDRYLGAYRYSTYKTYLDLTDRLTTDIVTKLMPACGRIRSVPYLTRDESLTNQPERRRIPRASLCSKPTEDTILPDLKPDKTTVIHFSRIPDDHIATDQRIDSHMITHYNLDTTMKMDHAFGDDKGRQLLLAEFQFAFTTFLLCHVYYCFEHWKKILQLVCFADSGLVKYHLFYADFARILMHQFGHVPDDLFDDIVDSNNLVRHLLDVFFQNVNDCHGCYNDLKQAAVKLKEVVEAKFGWQFDLEREDEQPVVVEL